MSIAKSPTSLNIQTDRPSDLTSTNEARKRKAEEPIQTPLSRFGPEPRKPFYCICKLIRGRCPASPKYRLTDGSDDWDESPLTPQPPKPLGQINADENEDPWWSNEGLDESAPSTPENRGTSAYEAQQRRNVRKVFARFPLRTILN